MFTMNDYCIDNAIQRLTAVLQPVYDTLPSLPKKK